MHRLPPEPRPYPSDYERRAIAACARAPLLGRIIGLEAALRSYRDLLLHVETKLGEANHRIRELTERGNSDASS